MTSIDRCYYRTITIDPELNLPLYVLDTTFLPSSIINSNNSNTDENDKVRQFIDTLISKIPDSDHSLVIFTNGFYQSSINNENKSSLSDDSSLKIPLQIIKFLKLIPSELKKNIRKIFIVHSNWILKSIIEIYSKLNLSSTKLIPIIINCENITALSKFIDITKIPISLHTYMIDKIQYKNNKIILSRHLTPIYSRPLTIYSNNISSTNNYLPLNQFSRIYNNLIAYLSNKSLDIQLSKTDWLTIIKCSIISNETKISIDILSDCLKRDQLIILSDYSFLEHYMILVKFILKLSNSNFPLIPLDLLINYKIDFNNLKQINIFLNKLLTYRHPLIDLDNNTKKDNVTSMTIDSYDNAYILIKIFKLFKFLSIKLEKETHILEPNVKNRNKSIERQSLRLILSFTKILYTDNEDSLINDDDDDIGFDNLFKLVRSIIENFDNLKIFNTDYTIDDFNNHLTFDDFIAFENFKNQQLGINDVIESKIINPNKNENKQEKKDTPTSPVKPNRIIEQNGNIKPQKLNFNTSSSSSPSPTPPTPRKNHLLYTMNNKSVDSKRSISSSSQSSIESISSNYLPTSADSSIPVTKSEIEMIAKSVESLGIDDDNNNNNDDNDNNNNIDLFTTPKRNNISNDDTDNETINDIVEDLLTPTQPSIMSPMIQRQINSLSTKSSNQSLYSTNFIKNNNLRKYTEKDLAVQQEVEKAKQAASIKEQQAKEVELGVRRGERKVSRLARLYEEKFMQ